MEQERAADTAFFTRETELSSAHFIARGFAASFRAGKQYVFSADGQAISVRARQRRDGKRVPAERIGVAKSSFELSRIRFRSRVDACATLSS